MKKYKLLKDLPGIGKGTIFNENDSAYKSQGFSYAKAMVEDNPDWFEKIVEDDVLTWCRGNKKKDVPEEMVVYGGRTTREIIQNLNWILRQFKKN